MKRFDVHLQHKSNSYILLCILLLFSFSTCTFSSFTLHAAELTTIPLESIPLPTEEAPNESETDIPAPSEVLEEIPVTELESVPFVSDTVTVVLLLAIVTMIIIIIITVISFFRNYSVPS